MSETREADGRRVWWKEAIKRYLISRFDGALVGGASHRDYLVKLGMPAARIQFGYDVVDNVYFEVESQRWREQAAHPRSTVAPPTVRPYFLASNRFVERKNLARLVEAYGQYCAHRQVTPSAEPGTRNQEPEAKNPKRRTKNEERRTKNEKLSSWNLCLLGDGELRSTLTARSVGLGLHVAECAPWDEPPADDHRLPSVGTVFFPGFRQISELPRFYAHAGCFVHPALAEPWGLVINEAMACALPILSSRNVGAAEELIEDGINGYRFDPLDVTELAEQLARVSAPNFALAEFGAASRRILAERAPTTAFGEGLLAALPLDANPQ